VGETILAASPHARFLNQQRGYIRCTVSRGRMTSDYRVVPYVSRPGAPIATRATMVVEDGRPGLERA
jgi:alkaline phosphatase D